VNDLAKKCINCDNNEVYEDNVAKCPRCGNFLRKVDESGFKNNTIIDGNTIQSDDPYANFYSEDIPKDHNNDDNKGFEKRMEGIFDVDDIPTKTEKTKQEQKKSSTRTIDMTQSENKESKASVKPNEPIAEGIVKNFFEQEIPTFFVTKVARTLFRGLPYVHSNVVNTFQLYSGWGMNDGDNNNGEEVIVYGKIAKGKLPENNRVKVWGKWSKSGSIVATKIKNETSNTWVQINHSIHPAIIWLIVALLVFIIYKISQINWGNVFSHILAAIMLILIVIICIFIFIVKPIKNVFK
jgi:hypothetical protein